jgi:hypothetical protein
LREEGIEWSQSRIACGRMGVSGGEGGEGEKTHGKFDEVFVSFDQALDHGKRRSIGVLRGRRFSRRIAQSFTVG